MGIIRIMIQIKIFHWILIINLSYCYRIIIDLCITAIIIP